MECAVGRDKGRGKGHGKKKKKKRSGRRCPVVVAAGPTKASGRVQMTIFFSDFIEQPSTPSPHDRLA